MDEAMFQMFAKYAAGLNATLMFAFFLVSCGFFLRLGFMLADRFVESVFWLWQYWRKRR